MKRWLSFLLAAAMLFCAPFACAEESPFDLSAMTLDELQALSHAINAEVDQRFGNVSGRIGSGYFVVGAGIIPGTYTLTDIRISYDYGMITLRDTEGRLLENFYVYNDSIFTVTLTDGMTLEIERVISAYVEKASAVWNVQ